MKIAIVRRNGLGDLLCAVPLALYLKELYPSGELTLFVDVRAAPLTPYLPVFDQVVVLPQGGNKYFNLGRVAWKHRGTFDLALSAKTSPMKLMNWFLFWLKAKKGIAYGYRGLPPCLEKRHQALKGLQLLDPHVQEVPERFYPKIEVEGESEPQTVLICASTTRAESRLSASRYSSLLNRLYKTRPFHLHVVGFEKDEKRARAMSEGFVGERTLHFSRSFEAFLLSLKRAECFFVEDGGVAHLGAALDKRGVVLYGGNDPTEWGPLSKRMICLSHPQTLAQLDDEQIYKAWSLVWKRK